MPNTFNLDEALSALNGNHAQFDLRVKAITCPKIIGSNRAQCKMYYLTFRDGLPTVTEFVEFLKWRLVPYCLPRKHREEVSKRVTEVQDALEMERLVVEQRDKAVSLFIKAQKQKSTKKKKAGEPGEVILYILLEWALKAPQIISKMYLKTSAEMPIHGSDGIHVGWDGTDMTFYLGESKLYESLPGGIGAVFTSIVEFLGSKAKQSREIEIIRDHMNLGKDMEELQTELLKYLDPYDPSGKGNQHRKVFACFVGYNFNKFAELKKVSPEKVEGEFIKFAEQRAKEAVELIEKRIGDKELEEINFEFFLIPFPSVDDFRTEFFKSIGITK